MAGAYGCDYCFCCFMWLPFCEKKEKNQINLSCIEICVKITTATGSKPSQYKKLGKVKNIAVAYELS